MPIKQTFIILFAFILWHQVGALIGYGSANALAAETQPSISFTTIPTTVTPNSSFVIISDKANTFDPNAINNKILFSSASGDISATPYQVSTDGKFLTAQSPKDAVSGTVKINKDGQLIGMLNLTVNKSDAPSKIVGVTDLSEKNQIPEIGLNDDLVVKLDGKGPIDATKYILFLDGRQIDGLEARYSSGSHAVIFHLRRTSTNMASWAALLGSPTQTERRVSVALGEKKTQTGPVQATITGDSGFEPQFSLVVLSGWWLVLAAAAVLMVAALIWGSAKRTTILKDNLLPQMPPDKQAYSLARWQMAFWFTLIFASFVFLFILLWDYNTITPQALTLMGISAATGMFAVAVDATKDSPIGAANNTLRALGLNSYADVVMKEQEIKDRNDQLKSSPPPDETRLRLQTEIADRQRLLRTYRDIISPFFSEGWYRDLTTDINGPALHRLQVFFWTWILGFVFLVGVYRDLAMPEFSGTLLALMAVSSAGYIGFKYPEKQQ